MGEPGPLPLEGIRILELGMVFVLPLAVTPLAAMGADVVKVEAQARPDSVRSGLMPDNQPRPNAYNFGVQFQALNRNKRGITLDLSKPEGREVLLRLVAVSDVVAENFTPRVLTNLGIGYEELAQVNPGIILLSSSGYGHTGPWKQYKAYGPNTESVDGLMHITGYPDGPPIRGGAGGLGVAFTDVAGALYGTYAILAALEQRERTGRGMWLDLSHYEAGVSTIAESVIDYRMNGRVQYRDGNRHPWRAPQGAYPCRGDDRWIAISVGTHDELESLADVLEAPALLEDRFRSLEGRHAHHDEADQLIAAATASWAAEDLERALQARGVAAHAVSTPRDVWFDPQLRYRHFFEQLPAPASAPDVGPRPHLRAAWKMSRTPAVTRSPAPLFGQHTREVLTEYLDMGEADFATLEAAGVIADEPRTGIVGRSTMDLPTMLAEGRFQEVDRDYRARLEESFRE